jgi:predicted metal-dependent phosphoesterase TrpH
MASVKHLKKFVNTIVDEINYDIELYVGLNLDKNHFEAQELYEEVYKTREKYLEKVNTKGLDKAGYKKIIDEFLHDVNALNEKLCKLIGKS